MKIIVIIIPRDLVINLRLSSFGPFLQTKNKSRVYRKLLMWKREIFLVFLKQVALYFKAMSNSIDFCKGIFLHVIPVRI